MSLRPVDLYWVTVLDQGGRRSEHLTPTDNDAIWEHVDQYGEPDMGDDFEWQVECEFWGTVELYYETAEERTANMRIKRGIQERLII